MARTINAAVRAVRRDAFVEAAQRLIARKGYEGFSVQDVLDEVGASKGAFYHYFDSKHALLTAVIDAMTDAVLALVEPVRTDPARPAVEKLRFLFSSIGQWKAERSDLIFELLEVWESEGNTMVREQLRTSVAQRLTDVLAGILHQGAAEGTMDAPDSTHTATVFLSLMLAANEKASRLFLAHRAGEVSLDEVEATLTAFARAAERVIGVAVGTLPFIDRQTLEFWYQPHARSERGSAA